MTTNQLMNYIEETRDWAIKALNDGNVERYEFLCGIIDKRQSELYQAELKAYISSLEK